MVCFFVLTVLPRWKMHCYTNCYFLYFLLFQCSNRLQMMGNTYLWDCLQSYCRIKYNTHYKPLFSHSFLILFSHLQSESIFREGLPNITKVEILFWALLCFTKLETYSFAQYIYTVSLKKVFFKVDDTLNTCLEHPKSIHCIFPSHTQITWITWRH